MHEEKIKALIRGYIYELNSEDSVDELVEELMEEILSPSNNDNKKNERGRYERI